MKRDVLLSTPNYKQILTNSSQKQRDSILYYSYWYIMRGLGTRNILKSLEQGCKEAIKKVIKEAI